MIDFIILYYFIVREGFYICNFRVLILVIVLEDLKKIGFFNIGNRWLIKDDFFY